MMSACHFNTFNPEVAEDYFAQLNPLAQRIASDITATKSTYGQLWYALGHNEQNDIINETLIKPEISLKYFDNFSSSTSFSSSDSSSSSSSMTSNATSAEQSALQGSAKNKMQTCSINASGSNSTTSLTDAIMKQTQRLLSSALPVRAVGQQSMAMPQFGKLKPPSSPPPPPPISNAKISMPIPNSSIVRPTTSPTKYTHSTNEISTCHAFDGRNLRTYAAQKVALKIIYDDLLGIYRDEHSRPFSYRTKSQINLQQHIPIDSGDTTFESGNDEICLLRCEQSTTTIADKVIIKNYKQLQDELKHNLSSQLNKIRNDGPDSMVTATAINYKCFDSSFAENNYATNKDNNKRLDASDQPPPVIPQPTNVTHLQTLRNANIKKNGLQNSLVDANTQDATNFANEPSTQRHLNYAVYTDAYFEHGESATLMHNCSNSGILTASSNSSTATSDDDEHNNYDYDDDDDEKTLCEDIRLLDNDLNLRRGFEFLNNW